MHQGKKCCGNHILHPSTRELHGSVYTSARQFKVFLLPALNIPKSSQADWGLSLTQELTGRRGTLHLPDGSATAVKAAVTAYQHLHKQTSCSNTAPWACFQLFLLWEAWVTLIIKLSLLTVFAEVLRNLRLRTLATKLQKKIRTSIIPADSCVQSCHWLLPRERSDVYLCTDASYTPLSPATDSSDTAADTHATFSAVPPAVFIPIREAQRKIKNKC